MRYSPGCFVLKFEDGTDGSTRGTVALAPKCRPLQTKSLHKLRHGVSRSLGIGDKNITASLDVEPTQELFSFVLPEHVRPHEAERKICATIKEMTHLLRSQKITAKSAKPAYRPANRLRLAKGHA
jgi:hypothetical protein